MKLARGHRLHLSGHRAADAQIREASAHQAARERHILGRVLQVLGAGRQAREEAERIVLQHIDALVVGAQIVDLLLVDGQPEVGADELHGVQLVGEARPFARHALDQAIAGLVADVLERGQIALLVGMDK